MCKKMSILSISTLAGIAIYIVLYVTARTFKYDGVLAKIIETINVGDRWDDLLEFQKYIC